MCIRIVLMRRTFNFIQSDHKRILPTSAAQHANTPTTSKQRYQMTNLKVLNVHLQFPCDIIDFHVQTLFQNERSGQQGRPGECTVPDPAVRPRLKRSAFTKAIVMFYMSDVYQWRDLTPVLLHLSSCCVY